MDVDAVRVELAEMQRNLQTLTNIVRELARAIEEMKSSVAPGYTREQAEAARRFYATALMTPTGVAPR